MYRFISIYLGLFILGMLGLKFLSSPAFLDGFSQLLAQLTGSLVHLFE